MAGITQCTKILIRILSFCNTRLQQQVVAGIIHGKLSDQFFCLNAMYEYLMVVKGYVHTVPDSETEGHRNWTVQCEQATSAPMCCTIEIKIQQSSPATEQKLFWKQRYSPSLNRGPFWYSFATLVQYPKSG